VRGIEVLESFSSKHDRAGRIRRYRDSTNSDQGVIETHSGTIVVVPGTQAISAEGLEVLSLGKELPDSDPMTLSQLVDTVTAFGGIAVVPWGVGKWLGRRGALVTALLRRSNANDSVLFADNANRPYWWPYPALLKTAQREGLGVITGSDPLPVRGDENRIGSAGVICAADSVETAWSQIRQLLLRDRGPLFETFGRPMSNTRFWKNQLLLRVQTGGS
jgi:hypothetical protein